MTDIRTGVTEKMITDFLGAFPNEFLSLNDKERMISAQIYRLLTESKPVSIGKVAATLDMPDSEVEPVIKSWPGVFYDKTGSIIGYWGLALSQFGDHRFNVNGHTLYAWCAWDSLFIPQIIQRTAVVTSKDAATGRPIRLTVTPENGIAEVDPESTVISFMMPPNVEEIRADVVTSFCHYLHFFSSSDSAREWISKSEKKDEMLILSPEEANDIGLRKNRLQYRELLKPLEV
ncbi:MAG: organomercurial lyase [Candidatus Neomarinimicrobiota bacterium]